MTGVYFIIGCTASGKGAVGREIAAKTGGSIISVDSMKVYRRMDIGTAKPAPEVRARIPHYCVDVVEPYESYSVAEFVACADAAISDIQAVGQTPLAVGGTSLYIKALSQGLFEGPSADAELRRGLQTRAAAEGLAALHAELADVDPAAAQRIHPNDEKRIIRALEVYKTTGRPISELQSQWDTESQRHDCVFLGIRRSKDDLSRRINLRVKKMVEMGLLDEVRGLLDEPRGLSPQAAQAVGYAEVIAHLRGECTFERAVERIKINTRQLAKKQRTWHRRFAGVQWFDAAPDEPPQSVAARMIAAVGMSERRHDD